MTYEQALLVVAVFIAAIGAVIDVRTGHIPNWLTLGTLGFGPVAHVAVAAAHAHSGLSVLQSLGFSLLGAIVCALMPFALYRAAGLGGGDVKLFAATGALTGVMVGMHAETYAFVAGMFWALLIVIRDRRLASTLGNVAALVGSPIRQPAEKKQALREKMTPIRFGPAIFLGNLAAAIICWRTP